MNKIIFFLLIAFSLSAFGQSNAIRCVEGFKGNDNFLFLRFDIYGVGTKKSKFLKTKNGLEVVSNIDNYKAHFTTAEKVPSLYIKIEVSDSASFETDKAIIVDNYQLLLQSTKRVQPKVDTLTIKGYNLYGYTKTEIDSAVSIASYVYFTKTNEAIYFNFMNRAGKTLLYKSISDFIEQRDLLLTNFVERMKKCN
jgi:hypothetical protein